MALPFVSSVEQCADFATTVKPFIPQLYGLPSRILAGDRLLDIYHETNPLISGLAFSLLAGFVFLVVSEINKNYSQVDRLWSILPTLYVVHLGIWAHISDLPYERLKPIIVFSFLWTCRLTFNYWRKGGYQKGSEDYRWAIVKKEMPLWAFFILNVTFISFMQSILLCLISLPPAYVILLANQVERGIRPFDLLYSAAEVGLVVSEWISDGQQWNYHGAKHQYLKDGKAVTAYQRADLDRGFLTSGMWSYSRHPNFAAEQTIWFLLYQWSCVVSGSLYSWALAGAGSLIILFQFSTRLTEQITASKYPDYTHYQEKVGMFLPKALQPYAGHRPEGPLVNRTNGLAKKAD